MEGLYYLLSLIFFWVIVYWFVKNDRLRPDEPTQGLLRMPDEFASEIDAGKGTAQGSQSEAR